MFDSVGDALDELWALRMKMGSSINKHIARFKLLAAAAEIDPNHALTIELSPLAGDVVEGQKYT